MFFVCVIFYLFVFLTSWKKNNLDHFSKLWDIFSCETDRVNETLRWISCVMLMDSLTLTQQRVFSKLHLRKMTLLPFKASVVFLRCWTVKTNFNCWCLLYRSAASSARWTAPSWRHWSRWECTKSTTFFMLRCKQALNCRAWKHVYSFVSRWGHENIKQDSSDSSAFLSDDVPEVNVQFVCRVSLFDYQAMCKNSHHHASSARRLLSVSLCTTHLCYSQIQDQWHQWRK